MMQTLTFTVPEDAGKMRLDQFLAAQGQGGQENGGMPGHDLSRSRIKALILQGRVFADGIVETDPSRLVRGGLRIDLGIPPAADPHPKAEAIDLDIVYEDDHLLVLNKAAGLVVHPGAGNADGTLVNALLHHCGDSLSGIGGVKRPGIVHRLDKETSGLMLVAKNDAAHKRLSAQLADRSLSRHYYALVCGVPALRRGRVDGAIGRHPSNRLRMAILRNGGREAATRYELAEKFADSFSLLSCQLETGRTHQVRVHMQSIGLPLVGDPLYGAERTKVRSLLKKGGFGETAEAALLSFGRQALHAYFLRFVHPVTGEDMDFEIDLPADMEALTNLLRAAAP